MNEATMRDERGTKRRRAEVDGGEEIFRGKRKEAGD